MNICGLDISLQRDAAEPAAARPKLPRFDPTFLYLGAIVLAGATAMSWRGWFVLGRLCGMVTPEAAGLSLLTDGFAAAAGRAAFGVSYASKRTKAVAMVTVFVAIAMSMTANGFSLFFAVAPGVMHYAIHSSPAPLWARLPVSMVAPLTAGDYLIIHALLHRDYKAHVAKLARQAEAAVQAEEAEAARQAEAELQRQAEAVAAQTAEAVAARAQAEAEAARLSAQAAADQARAEAEAAEARRLAAEARQQQGTRDRKPAPPKSPAPASRRPSAASPQATEESIDRLMTAMDALRDARREGRDLNGAQIGSLVGISSRGGRDLRKRALLQLETEAEAEAAFAGIAGGSGTADGSGSGSGSDAR